MLRTILYMCALLVALGSPDCVLGDSMTVKTEQGKVHGKTINNGNVRAFLSLPYAAPPIGDLRWKPPAPPLRWHGLRDATSYGARCAQNDAFPDMIFQDSGPSEDCLFLNVFVPSDAKPKSKLPVMLWIHGGGYFTGSASEPRHDGDFLPTREVVLVTINYRLDVFGFLVTSDLAREAGGAAGNYGLLDMIAALQWVRANIERFGGDPGNVTIFGESAGSIAVSTLMVSPLARGLFQKAIGESGSALGISLGGETVATQAPVDDAWVASLGVKSLENFRAMPTAAVLQAARRKGSLRFLPVVDGKVLTESVPDAYATGKQAHVPLLAGWNRDEGGLAQGMTAVKWKDTATRLFGDRSAEFLDLYPGESDERAMRSAIDYFGDNFIAFATWKWIEAQASSGEAPVYRYHFELAAPVSKFHPASLAFHADEIEYVFGTLDTRPGPVWRPEDRRLSEQMMDYWTNFAKTGDPNGPGLPVWPRFDKDRVILHFDSEVTARRDTTRPRYEFLLRNLPPKQQ